MALAAQQKSTLVRAKIWLDRLGFRSADLIAPAVAGRFARDLWFAAPPRMPAGPVPKGGRPFTVRSLGGTIRGHVWTPTDDIAPVVYLVHGWGGRGTQFATHVQPLVEAGFRVVMFDAPAHGDSDQGPHGHLTNGVEFGRALDAVFAKFGPAHAVVAHSLGAISTYLTLRYGWLSTRRLVLIAPMVEAESLLDQFQEALGFGPRTRSAFDREVDRFVGIPVSEFDAGYQAARVDPVPTLVVHDRGDRQTPYDAAVRLASHLGAQLLSTDGLGHRRVLRDDLVVRAVVTFLNADLGKDQAVA